MQGLCPNVVPADWYHKEPSVRIAVLSDRKKPLDSGAGVVYYACEVVMSGEKWWMTVDNL